MRCKILIFITWALLSISTLYAEKNTVNGMVVGQSVNLRAGPNWTAKVLTTLNRGCMLTVLEINHQWYRVRLTDRCEGWIYKDYITTKAAVIENQCHFLAKAQKITEYAKSYLGVKYSYGGTSPDGFDCSGYTRFVYAKFGYKLPHNALSQMELGEWVNQFDLALGDLLFFSTMYSSPVNHVGIYLGGGDFIHASSGSGRIRIDSMSEPYYSRRYRGARRILNYQGLSACTPTAG
jgi:cell wall-associated NlpC family hydrolase